MSAANTMLASILQDVERTRRDIRDYLKIEDGETAGATVYVGEWEHNKGGGDCGKAVFSMRGAAMKAAMSWAVEMHKDRTADDFPLQDVTEALNTQGHYWNDIHEWGVSVCPYTVDEE